VFGKEHRGDGAKQFPTNSVAIVPVFGNNPGEPTCGGTSWCYQAYRWHLDHVVDPRGNSMTIFYDRLLGQYAVGGNAAYHQMYTVNTRPRYIEYGTRQGAAGDPPAPAVVTFEYNNRCSTADPSQCQKDVPWDQYCALEATRCDGRLAPTFWEHYGLDSVSTKVWDATAGGYRNGDRWQLRHSYPDPGDASPVTWWLNGVTHISYASGTAVSEPEVRFGGWPYASRVAGSTGGEYRHFRLNLIVSGTGAETHVTYNWPDCTLLTVAPADANTKRC
jgi:hypothetical protein